MHDEPAARRHRGELFAALAAMAYGSSYVATAFALRGWEPVPAAAWRSLAAGVLLGVIVVGRSGAARRAPTSPAATTGARATRLIALALLGGPLFLAALNLAVAHVGATISAFVAGLYAVLAAVIAPVVLPERPSVRVLIGFVLALVGTALLAELDPARSDAVGIAWGLTAAILFALFLVLTRRWSAPYGLDGISIALATTTVSTVALMAVVLVTAPSTLVPARLPPEAVVATLWLAVMAALGQTLTVASVRLIPAARSAAFLLLNPITATVLAVVLLGERPSAAQLAGGSLVLAGIAAATIPVRRQA